MRCAVFKCETKCGNKESQSFKFPKNRSIAEKWIRFCGRPNKELFMFERAHVCIKHFKKDDFMNKMQYDMGYCRLLRLKHDAVPSLHKNKEAKNGQDKVRAAPKNVKPVIENIDILVQETLEDVGSDNGAQVESSDEFERLKKEIENLKRENSNYKQALEKEKMHNKNMEEKLEAIFTPVQISKLRGEDRLENWNMEDISKSMQLHSMGAKTYEFLLENNFPLPSVETLHMMAQKIDISAGLIGSVMKVLSAHAGDLKDTQKLCVLSFAEMVMNTEYAYDKASESFVAIQNIAQVAMLRGLKSEWSQPVFFEFDRSMSPYMLSQILEEYKKCGYIIVAVVSDLHPSNKYLHSQLKITMEEPFFHSDGQKIFVFTDVQNLLCLLATHFLKSGLIIEGKPVNREVIEEILSITSTPELAITHKICLNDLRINDSQECSLKVATKLFSNTIAQAITKAAELGYLQEKNWQACYKMFKLANDWYDVMNSRIAKSPTHKRMCGYGLALDAQNEILDGMISLVKDMRVIGNETLLSFQTGIIQTSNALKLLLIDIKEKYNAKYILTNRLNINPLENLFDNIRYKVEMNDPLTQEDFQNALRSYIIRHNEYALLCDNDDFEFIEETEQLIDYDPTTEEDRCHEEGVQNFTNTVFDILDEEHTENVQGNWIVQIN